MKRFLLLAQLPSALMVLYLDILSVAALLRRRMPTDAPPISRFAVLVPAHNEEKLLPRLLATVDAMTYPRSLYDTHVVADNCIDHTAQIAATRSAVVHERYDEDQRGKGYALDWLVRQIRGEKSQYDAFVVVDADSLVSPNFLEVMNNHLVSGDAVIQSYYGVENWEASWSSALRFAGLALYNDLRPRGRDALGLSAGLRGNGMCFSTAVIERFGWEAFTLAEDAEFHLKLVDHGVRVVYAPDAAVLAEMPDSLVHSRTQNVRWERGRLQILRSSGIPMLIQAVRDGDPVRFDAAAEQVVPPLSVLAAITTLSAIVMVLLRAPGPRRLALLTLAGEIGYVISGLRLVHAPARIYLALLKAPYYIIWKVWIYAVAALDIEDARWIRTTRSLEDT